MWAYTQDMKIMADDVSLAYRRAGFDVRTYAFYHTFDPLAVAALNAKANGTIQQEGDSLFAWLATCGALRQNGRQHTTQGLGLKLTDVQSGYNFSGRDFRPHEAVAGSAESPYIMPFPWILQPYDRVRAEVIHFAGIGPTTIPNPDTTPITYQLTLLGIRIYTFPFTRKGILPEH